MKAELSAQTAVNRQVQMIRSSVKAFTLTELLLAAAILAFALLGILMLYLSVFFLNEANRNQTVACAHAQFAMEEVKNTNFASIQNQTWDDATLIAKGLTPLNNETVVIRVNGPEPLDVTVTVDWRDRGIRSRSIAFKTLITEP